MSDTANPKPGDRRAPQDAAAASRPFAPAAGARRRRGVWVGGIALVLLSLALYQAARRDAPDPGRSGGRGAAMMGKPMPVVAAPAIRGDIDVVLTALGTVTPVNSVIVRTRVDGQLVRVAFNEGQRVKAGDLLAEIDARAYQAQLTQAEGQLARDRALLQNARLDLQRYQALLAQDSIALQQVDTQAALVRQYEGTVRFDQGAVDSARVQLSYTRILAPVSGRVGLRRVDPGNIAQASDANGLVAIAQMDPITVLYALPEDALPSFMPKLQAGERLPVEAWNRDQTALLARGALITADNLIDASTGTIKLRARFPNRDATLFPNQFVNVRMRVQTLRDVVIVPSAAVQRGVQGAFVYVVGAAGRAALRPVALGAAEGDRVSVVSGLEAGERVVIDGADKLRDGAPVTVARSGAARGGAFAAPAPR